MQLTTIVFLFPIAAVGEAVANEVLRNTCTIVARVLVQLAIYDINASAIAYTYYKRLQYCTQCLIVMYIVATRVYLL